MSFTEKSDTKSLLAECASGAKMAVSSIDEVTGHINDDELRDILRESRDEHAHIERRCGELLAKYGEEGEPSAMAKGMSWLKTNFMLDVKPGDKTVAALMTDGCDMGVKSLNGYINDFPNADGEAKSIAKRLIEEEKHLHDELESYL